jgi:hypothetical protein
MTTNLSVPMSKAESGTAFHVDASTSTFTMAGPVGGGTFDLEMYQCFGTQAAGSGYTWVTIASPTVVSNGLFTTTLPVGGMFRLVLRTGSGNGYRAYLP